MKAALALAVLLPLALTGSGPGATGPGTGLEDERVLLQAFDADAHRRGGHWYRELNRQVPQLAALGVDLVWLPPPAYAGSNSAGYNPKQYGRLDNSYGSVGEQRQLLQNLRRNGLIPLADVVINHRDGTHGWGDFVNPRWGPEAICADDEVFSNPASELRGYPRARRGACEVAVPYRAGGTYAYPAYRDLNLDHPQVQRDILRYLQRLQALGYEGWRYDMAHGYDGRWVGRFNRATRPRFSVGETDWGRQDEMRGWIWATATTPEAKGREHLRSSSAAFDMPTLFQLRQALVAGRPQDLSAIGDGHGLIGDGTDGLPWRSRAVTAVANHDIDWPSNAEGLLPQAYALVLSHPGIPSVYLPHVQRDPQLRDTITTLIRLRRLAGVTAGSRWFPQRNARQAGVYGAAIEGRRGMLLVRIGGDDSHWQPRASGYRQILASARGHGWAVWLAQGPPQPG
ncbi:MAG: alpha-amylase family glycosyl hydrolase [Synechococcus sp.]